jgi:hypothetical protein
MADLRNLRPWGVHATVSAPSRALRREWTVVAVQVLVLQTLIEALDDAVGLGRVMAVRT